MEENRISPRVRTNAVVTYKVKTNRLTGGSRIIDISETGLAIPSKHYYAIGDILEMEIRSEDLKEPMKVSARVTRIEKRNSNKFQFEVGLAFLDLLPVQKRTLHDYIQLLVSRGDNLDISWLD